MRFDLLAFATGIVFAIGLGLGGMTDPAKVRAFLDVAGAWDPSLAFVMAGAIAVFAPVRAIVVRRARARNESAEPALPTAIDRDLVIGAALFGIGWGLVGYCPGPAIVAIASLAVPAIVTASAMLLGMRLFSWWRGR